MVDHGDKENGLETLGLREIRDLARKNTPQEAWEHIMGSAESRTTLRRNQAAMRRILFRQRIFHDITKPETTVELFGRQLPIPMVIAPVGSFSKINARGERDVAEGAGRAGVMVFVSQAARLNARDWAEGASSPLVFMGYLSRGRKAVLEYARLAEDLGYAAVGLTMDTIEPVKIGDHIPLQADGRPRKGYPASPRDIEWLKAKPCRTNYHGES